MFDDLRHIDENGNEYWFARELQAALQYKEWRNFQKVISTAQIACKISQQDIDDHFVEVNKMVEIGSGAKRSQIDYKLTRYACYLIVMNGDPRKEVIAWGQTYFAVKTRQQELAELTNSFPKMRNACLSAATSNKRICCLHKRQKRQVLSLLWNMPFSKMQAIADSMAV